MWALFKGAGCCSIMQPLARPPFAWVQTEITVIKMSFCHCSPLFRAPSVLIHPLMCASADGSNILCGTRDEIAL